MLKDVKICFIGSGTMATAMLAGLFSKELVTADNIIASDPYQAQLDKLAARHGIHTTQNNLEAVKGRDVVILSIKPQNLPDIAATLKGHIPANALVISILAGVPVRTISRTLHHYRVVRVMPNTPARIGKGMSVWMATDEVNDAQQQHARTILQALGEEVQVDKEEFLDMATALSGTGPAYVFLFMEAMIDAGVHMGFPRRVAEQLVFQTVEGSVTFARDSERHLAELRNMVTSSGGTTAEALYEMEKGGFRTVLSKSIWAAYQKSRYLGGVDNDA